MPNPACCACFASPPATPQVLLLDEITVDMDVVGRLDLLHFFTQECEERGATIIYVSQSRGRVQGPGGWLWGGGLLAGRAGWLLSGWDREEGLGAGAGGQPSGPWARGAS